MSFMTCCASSRPDSTDIYKQLWIESCAGPIYRKLLESMKKYCPACQEGSRIRHFCSYFCYGEAEFKFKQVLLYFPVEFTSQLKEESIKNFIEKLDNHSLVEAILFLVEKFDIFEYTKDWWKNELAEFVAKTYCLDQVDN